MGDSYILTCPIILELRDFGAAWGFITAGNASDLRLDVEQQWQGETSFFRNH